MFDDLSENIGSPVVIGFDCKNARKSYSSNSYNLIAIINSCKNKVFFNLSLSVHVSVSPLAFKTSAFDTYCMLPYFHPSKSIRKATVRVG